jgi:hypothetical protein
VVIGKTEAGMSMPRSRFGDRPLLLADRPYLESIKLTASPILQSMLDGGSADPAVMKAVWPLADGTATE